MNTIKIIMGFLVVLSLAVAVSPAGPAVDWSGMWVGSVDTGGMGVDALTLVLKKSGPTFAGTINDALNLVEKDTVLTDVKTSADEISFSFKALGGSADFALKMTAAGNKISAQIMNKAVGEWGSFEIAKKK